jgi:hypothetical protein
MCPLLGDGHKPQPSLYIKFDSASNQLVHDLQEITQLLIGPATEIFLLMSALAWRIFFGTLRPS